MKTINKKHLFSAIALVLILIATISVIANWEEFKKGFDSGYEAAE
ncbi:MAG: hypothetical protein QMB39_05910 [Bacteroidales bacterium]|jgi:hypothetical protein